MSDKLILIETIKRYGPLITDTPLTQFPPNCPLPYAGQNHATESRYTWRRANGAQASRLDMFWISSYAKHLSQFEIFLFFWSDHSYVFLKLSFPSLPDRGPGVDETLAQEVRDFWL